MTVQSAEFLEAVMHLPSGGRLTLVEVGWSQYEQLLSLVGNRPHLRISFDSGRLEIISTSAKHERLKNLIHDLVSIISVMKRGLRLSVTVRRRYGAGLPRRVLNLTTASTFNTHWMHWLMTK